MDYGFGELVGAVVATGETAGDVCAAVVPGDDAADDFGAAGAGEVCGDGWFFISSRRKALLAVLWCA